MVLDKMRIKCVLGGDIRVVTAKKEVTEDELLTILEHEYGHAMIVSQYEDHEGDKVTVSSTTGLQAVLTEHAEIHSSGPMPYLKLYLQPRILISSEDPSYPYSPITKHIPILNTSNGINGMYVSSSPSPRNVEMGNGTNGHPPPRRSSSKLNTPPILDNPTNHPNKPSLEIDLKYVGSNSSMDDGNAPPFRTPPRSPPSSPRNPLRTPPGSPKGARADTPEERFPRNLHIETDPNLNQPVPLSAPNSVSPRHVNLNPRHGDPHHPYDRYPHYLLHSESESHETSGGGSTPRSNSNDTPPIRTPPQSPRGSTRDNSPPITPSSLPPIPWLPLAPTEKRSPVVPRKQPPQNPAPAIDPNDIPGFPVPRSPPALPVPIPFPMVPKSPRVTSPKLPPSILEQNKQDEEKGPIKWEKGPVVGRGGFGCVYMGMRDNGELIAVKQLEFDETEDPKSRATVMSFAQEIKVMKDLRHENIVRYLGIQLEDKCLNIFLEYVAGGSISTLLGKFMKFPEPVIRVYTKQILQGLAYLHEHHIMHRDIKGANILVDVNGTVKLADFGCSKIFEVKSQLKTVLGTPYWMAPEVIKQSGYGRSADIWSVGCVIIEMATGHPPWQAMFQEVTAAMFHIASTESPPEFPANLSPEAHDFLSLCFKRNPKERPHAKTLLKHAFLQEISKDTQTNRRNSIGTVPTTTTTETPVPVSPALSRLTTRNPSMSSPPLPISPFTTKYKLEYLPTRVLLVIFRLLPVETQPKMRYVCKHFSNIVKDDLWNKINLKLKRTRSGTGGSTTSTDSRRLPWSEDKITTSVLKGHTKSVLCLAVAEAFIASSGEDKKIRLWDKRNRALMSLKGHTSTVTGICVDKSSNIYSSSADTSVRIWSPYKNGTLSKKCSSNTLTGPTSPLTSVTLMDSETKIASGSFDKTICVWDASGKNALLHTLTGHEGAVTSVRGDGMTLVSASSDGTLKVWDLRTPSLLVKTLTGHVGEVKCCYFANNRLVSGGEDKLVRSWDIGTGKVSQKLDHGYNITGVSFDSTKIASSGDKMVKLWEWDSDICARVLGLASLVYCVHTDEQRVIAAGQDKVVRVLTPDVGTPKTSLFVRLTQRIEL